MTSQVAIMNLNGVAVASDTVVTSTGSDGSYKVIGGVSKIYWPGDPHKFVILHSGGTQINGVPHQLHIYEWFKTLAKPLPSLQAYVDSYRTWVASEKKILSEYGERHSVNQMLNECLYELKKILLAEAATEFGPEITERKKKNMILSRYSEKVEEYFSELNSLDEYSNFTDKQASNLLSKGSWNLEEKISFILGEFDLGTEVLGNIESWSYLILSRTRTFESESTLGFCGFGEDESFARLIRLHTPGVYGGSLQARVSEPQGPEPGSNESSIQYFAQYDTMWGFVAGFNPDVEKKFLELVEEKVEERWGSTTEHFIGQEVASEIRSQIADYSQEQFVSPFLRSVEAMSASSLVELAESLVSLQFISTYRQPGAATVGGPIEVFTIDRISGVVARKLLSRD
jgi:hypothetical protein